MPKKKKLIELFESKGLLFPSSDQEVEAFESMNSIINELPADWDAPEQIIKRGIQKLDQISHENDRLNSQIESLKMVARNGGEIPQNIIDKMRKNHLDD